MAGKFNLTQPRSTAMPTDHGCELVVLHDFSGEMGMESQLFGKSSSIIVILLDNSSINSIFIKTWPTPIHLAQYCLIFQALIKYLASS
jgi:hypothetical protein